jgi:type III secretory pathway component EscV
MPDAVSKIVFDIEPLIKTLLDSINEHVEEAVTQVLDKKFDSLMSEYLQSQDAQYIIEDLVRDRMSDLVDEYVRNISLRVEID